MIDPSSRARFLRILAKRALLNASKISKPEGGAFRQFSTTTKNFGGGHHIAYRARIPADKTYQRGATILGAVMWWWIFWHCFTDYHHIIGHYEFPDYSKWTNEELGVPSE